MALIDPSLQYIEFLVDSTKSSGSSRHVESALDSPFFSFTQKTFLCAGIKILSAEVPFSYYVIDNTNNALAMNTSLVEIPVGTYNADTLATVIKTAAEAVTGGTWTITWDNVYLKYSFSWTDGFINYCTLDFIFADKPYYKELKDILGFTQDSYATTGTITSDKVASPMGPTYLYINSRRIGRGIDALLPAAEDGSAPPVDQLCRIPINVNYSDIIFFQDEANTTYFDFAEGTSFNGFDLYCTLGTSDKVLRFNGLGFSVRIGLYVYRDASRPLASRPDSKSFIS
jgi:hypothetical protein